MYGEKYELHSISFSLGGNQVSTAFYDGNKDPEKKPILDEYDSILLVAPGGQAFASDKIPSAILADSRTNLLVNRSDLLSQAYTQNSHDSSRVWYGDGTWKPNQAHSFEQFGSQPQERDNNELLSPDTLMANAQKGE